MATVIGQSTDPNQPGVLGTPIAANQAPDTPGTQSIGVKGDGGAGFPPAVPATSAGGLSVPAVPGRIAIGVLGTSADPYGAGVLGQNTGGGTAGLFLGDVQVNGNLSAGGTLAAGGRLTANDGVFGNSTDPNFPGVLGTPMAANKAPNVPGTQSIGVKGDGGTGFPPAVPATSVGGVAQPAVLGRIAIGVLGTTADPNGFGVWGENTGGGVGIYGRGGTYAAQLDGNVLVSGTIQANGGNGRAVNATSSAQDAVNGTCSTSAHAGVSATNSASGGTALWASGTTAGQFEGNVVVTGTLTVSNDATVTGQLTVNTDIILSGQDCAEEFDLAGEVEPGTVMVLDEMGTLEPSRQTYDKKVAGVVAGAGDYRPGMILGRRDSAHKRAPLALVGKVYCKVDAREAPVEVGDLLTTSSTPGHAMKASDPMRAFGAVIGKALQRLPQGRGLVPILVALQ